MEKQVISYIEKQNSPQRQILQEVRKIFFETLPDCQEKMMWGVITFEDGKFYIAAMKNRVHVGFAVMGLSDEEIGLFEGKGKTMRHIKVPTIESIERERLVKLIKMVDKKATCKPC
jgi:uncharacterized protein YdhG (YjbR/CyaY superfamily)